MSGRRIKLAWIALYIVSSFAKETTSISSSELPVQFSWLDGVSLIHSRVKIMGGAKRRILSSGMPISMDENETHIGWKPDGFPKVRAGDKRGYAPAPREAPGQPTAMQLRTGLVMTNITVYLLYYGRWTVYQKSIVRTFLESIADKSVPGLGAPTVSQWFDLVRMYYDSTTKHAGSIFKIGGEVSVGAPFGYGVGKAGGVPMSGIYKLLEKAMMTGALQQDVNGMYLILTSGDVSTAGFCTSFCGWHGMKASAALGWTVKFAFVGNPSKCLSACGSLMLNMNYPNIDPGLDSMISIIGHEIAEMATNPLLNTWSTANGAEVADICSWHYGKTFKSARSKTYNLAGSKGKNFLIQQIWNLEQGTCDTAVGLSPGGHCGAQFGNVLCTNSGCCSNTGVCGYGADFCNAASCFSGPCQSLPPPPSLATPPPPASPLNLLPPSASPPSPRPTPAVVKLQPINQAPPPYWKFCVNLTCSEHANCLKLGNVYKCQCKPGYEGDGKTCTAQRPGTFRSGRRSGMS